MRIGYIITTILMWTIISLSAGYFIKDCQTGFKRDGQPTQIEKGETDGK